MPLCKRVVWSFVMTVIVVVAVRLSGAHDMVWGLLGPGTDRVRASMHQVAQGPTEEQGEVSDEVLRLRVENAELRRRIREYDSISAEHGTALNAARLLRSRVIGRSAEQGRHFVHIDAGALDGVHVGDPVLVGWTLIGIVRGEAADRSLVQLLTDKDARVAAALYAQDIGITEGKAQDDSPLAEGVVMGQGDRWSLGMGHVEARSRLEVTAGMRVVTSGLEPNIPFGLVIGTVNGADVSPDSDLWDIQLRPNRLWGSYPTVVVLRRVETLLK